MGRQRLVSLILILFIAFLSFSVTASARVPATDAKIIAFRAIDFVDEGGGEVKFPTGRAYPTISHWDYTGHWLEWEIDVPEDGLYLTFAMYGTGNHLVDRQLIVDGEPILDLVFWTTDDFKNYKLGFFDPVNLTAGKHKVRLLVSANEGEHAGINLAWFAFATPDIFTLEDDEIVAVIDEMLGF